MAKSSNERSISRNSIGGAPKRPVPLAFPRRMGIKYHHRDLSPTRRGADGGAPFAVQRAGRKNDRTGHSPKVSRNPPLPCTTVIVGFCPST